MTVPSTDAIDELGDVEPAAPNADAKRRLARAILAAASPTKLACT